MPAQAAIEIATSGLELFAATTSGQNRAEEINSLRQSLTELAGEIETRSEGDVIAVLEQSWEAVANWFEDV